MKRLLEGLDRNEVAAKAVIEAGDRAVTAPALLQLLAPPAGSPGKLSSTMGEEAFLKLVPRISQAERALRGPLLRVRWLLWDSSSKPVPAGAGAPGTGRIRRLQQP